MDNNCLYQDPNACRQVDLRVQWWFHFCTWHLWRWHLLSLGTLSRKVHYLLTKSFLHWSRLHKFLNSQRATLYDVDLINSTRTGSWCVQKTLTELQPETNVSRCQCVRIEDRHHFYWLFGLCRLQRLSDSRYRAKRRRYCSAFVTMAMFCYVWESAKMCSRPKVAVTTLTSGLILSKLKIKTSLFLRTDQDAELRCCFSLCGWCGWLDRRSLSRWPCVDQKQLPVGCNLTEVCPHWQLVCLCLVFCDWVNKVPLMFTSPPSTPYTGCHLIPYRC